MKEPVAEEYHRLGAAHGPGPLHLSPPGRVPGLHRRARRRRATSPSPTRRCAWRTTRSRCSRPMSEVAGRMAPLMGAHHLMRPGGGRGVLVCGVPGVRCASVVILGAGVAGMAAATMAVGMHSEVFVLDRNLERLREVDHHFRGALETVASSEHAIEEVCLEADIVIGAVLVVGARAPRLVSDALVEKMRPRFGPGRHLGRPGGLLRVDPPHHALEPDLRGARVALLLRGQHARRGPAHLDPRAGQRHAALHAAHRRPRLARCGAGRPRAGRGGQRRGRQGRLPARSPTPTPCRTRRWTSSSTDESSNASTWCSTDRAGRRVAQPSCDPTTETNETISPG